MLEEGWREYSITSSLLCYRPMAVSSKPLGDVGQVTIVGVGLLGGSIGLALRQAGYGGRIVGVGRRREVVERAVQLGCIDAAAASIEEAFIKDDQARQLAVICTPLSAFEGTFAEIAAYADWAGIIVTDAGSTKQFVCEQALKLLPDAKRFVGAHPMAGSELHGPEHARADLFQNRLCILTPSGTGSSDAALGVVRAFWSALGMKLTEKSPAEHDKVVAAISHLPHAAAVLLVQLADQRKAISIAATGFRDTTRVASGDPRVWTDIFTTNREAMLDAIDHFAGALDQFRAVVASSDEAEMLRVLTDVKQARDTWLKQTWGE